VSFQDAGQEVSPLPPSLRALPRKKEREGWRELPAAMVEEGQGEGCKCDQRKGGTEGRRDGGTEVVFTNVVVVFTIVVVVVVVIVGILHS
jgi:hypothetical protein